MSTNTISLMDLPPEILIHILSMVNLEDHTNVVRVNKHFYKLADDPSYWASICKQYFPYLLESQDKVDQDLKSKIIREIHYYKDFKNIYDKALKYKNERLYWSSRHHLKKYESQSPYESIPLHLILAALKGDLTLIENTYGGQNLLQQRTVLYVLAAANGHMATLKKVSQEDMPMVCEIAVANNFVSVVEQLIKLNEKNKLLNLLDIAANSLLDPSFFTRSKPNIKMIQLILKHLSQFDFDSQWFQDIETYLENIEKSLFKGNIEIARLISGALLALKKKHPDKFKKSEKILGSHDFSIYKVDAIVLAHFLALFSSFDYKTPKHLELVLRKIKDGDLALFLKTCREVMEANLFEEVLFKLDMTAEAAEVLLLQYTGTSLIFSSINAGNELVSNNNNDNHSPLLKLN